MKLTGKQEDFCAAYIETGNASEAYRRSYDVKKMKPESVNRLAKAMMDNIKIASRLEELKKPVLDRALLTLETHLERLNDLSLKAEMDKQYSAAISAEVARGKAAGVHIEKFENTNTNKTVNFIEAKDD